MRLVIALMRHDLRLADNPIINALSHAEVQHFIPLFVCRPLHLDIQGFVKDGGEKKSSTSIARSRVGKFRRCGSLRAQFLVESLWDIKSGLRGLGSDLVIRVGDSSDVLKTMMEGLRKQHEYADMEIWFTKEFASEEVEEEKMIKKMASRQNVACRVFDDESTLIHRLQTFSRLSEGQSSPYEITSESLYRYQKPFRSSPEGIPPQEPPYFIPDGFDELMGAMLLPLGKIDLPPHAAFRLKGGENSGIERIHELCDRDLVQSYKRTRNQMMGADYSTKLSAHLSMGCISARTINDWVVKWEEFHGGECQGTVGIRFELLWRDCMRHTVEKYGKSLFYSGGYQKSQEKWKGQSYEFERWKSGNTGVGLIDANMRELNQTGFMSNRGRQNVASFLTKDLYIDWRLGAEYFEEKLVDYDVYSNWANWQYVAGVGNDPRGSRRFNPLKQSHDYDPKGDYIRAWIPEARHIKNPEHLFSLWKIEPALRQGDLAKLEGVTNPLRRLEWKKFPGKQNGRKR